MLVGLVVPSNIGLDTKNMIVGGLEEEKCQNTHFSSDSIVYINLGVDEMYLSPTSLIFVTKVI